MVISLALNLILAIGLAIALGKIKNYREDRKQRGVLKPWPIPLVDADTLHSCFRTGPLGPDLSTEIRSISTFRVVGGISDFETWLLCNLARDARRVFELGTCTGKTTYLLAANTPPNCEIITITLKPDDLPAYKACAGDDGDAKASAEFESQFVKFYYSGTPEESKITQLFGDSKDFDEAPYEGNFDLVFVDGSHARSYVESDSRKALRMVRRGGVVVWHDYRGPRRASGVFQALNSLSRELPLVHIKGTSMVAYRRPTQAPDS